MEYLTNATEVEEIAKEIMELHYPNLRDAGLDIAYMWRTEAMALGEGRVAAGQCVHVADREFAIHGHDFLIIMARDVWNDASEEFRRAVVDHELSHVGIRYDEDGGIEYDEDTNRAKTFCRRHEVEEFSEVLERHGAYHSSLVRFLNSYGKVQHGTGDAT
jgi:hypothetical protein